MEYIFKRFRIHYCKSIQKWIIIDIKGKLKNYHFNNYKHAKILVDFLNLQESDIDELINQLEDCIIRIQELEKIIKQLGGQI